MRTSSRPTMTSSHPHHAHHTRQAHGAKSTTPITSPRLPHSVGQPYPPGTQLSPAATRDGRTPSPNYFGLNIDSGADPRDSGALPRDNWSPATSSVKSFGAAIPKQVPLDANPDFEAFRRQADLNRGSSFTLGSAHFAMPPPPTTLLRPRPPRRTTEQSDAALDSSAPRPVLTRSRETTGSRMDLDADSLHDSAYVSSDSKRNSEVSLNAPSFFDAPRHESPAQTGSLFHPLRRSNLSQVEDARQRLSLPQNKLDRPAHDTAKPRSETLPPALDSGGPSLLMPDQLRDIIKTKAESDYLLLDVRVATHYAQARIQGALNLCIPTTLLKRATFDIQKLKRTLQTEEDQEKFSEWDHVKYLIIYDAASSEKRDAMSAMNMFKKFTNEGFSKESYLLRGGFSAFAEAHPEFVDTRSAAERAGHPADTSSAGGGPTFAPVIGGVSLPVTANNPNPFFSNIRQNMDLADGVGQMDVAVPNNMDETMLPRWLRDATSRGDHGKRVANKFLSIERSEQARMKEAYSAFDASAAPKTPTARVSLSGIEKGVKNRYKDILPFDHARVVLANKPKGACDYINASHVRAPRSNKRYIASQGPLPATFEDFWSVIWDQDVRVIVMLTAESEGGQLKCHSYWNDREYGPVKLKPLSEKKVSLDIDKHKAGSSATPSQSDSGRRRANTTTTLDSSAPAAQPSQSEAPHVIIRKFAMSHASHPFAPMREVTHLHYPSWPDFGVPAQPSHLLALVELANVMQRSALPVNANRIAASVAGDRQATPSWYEEPENDRNARPMLVHCSAGCGRTGTFCTVDSVIDMLKRQRLASVAAKRKRDADGDVSMGDPASSFSSNAGYPRTQDNKINGHGSPLDSNGLDTRWLGDDSVDLIARTVEDFREQRLSMVQSLRQFVLCYETIIEWVWRLQEQINANGRRGHFRSESEAPSRR